MVMKVNVGGVWKAVPTTKVNVGGVWKTCNQISVNIGGIWKDCLATGTVPSVSNIYIAEELYPTTLGRCGIVFHDDRTGVGSDDGRILTRRSGVATYYDLGSDELAVDHTGEWTTDVIVESEWEVACTSEDIGTWDTFYAAVGTYTSLDTPDMLWMMLRAGGKGYVAGTDRCKATFRIREVADTGNYADFTVDCYVVQYP